MHRRDGSAHDRPRLRRPGARRPEAAPERPLAITYLRALGVEDGSDGATLGQVADVAADRRGRAYVLDVINHRVVVFSPDGRLEHTLGREGRGPGEFQVATAMAMDGRDHLYVLDVANARLEVFDVSGERGAWLRSLPLTVPGEDVCAAGDRVFLLGARGGWLIHELSPETGRVARSLARDSTAGGEVMAGSRAAGYLACGPGDALTFLPSTRGEVLRFSASTGERTGRLEIPGYRAARITDRADGAVVFEAPGGGPTDNGSSIVNLPDGRQLAQVGVVRAGGAVAQFGAVRGILLDWQAGSATPLPDSMPRIVNTAQDRAYAADAAPYPAVRVMRLTASPAHPR